MALFNRVALAGIIASLAACGSGGGSSDSSGTETQGDEVVAINVADTVTPKLAYLVDQSQGARVNINDLRLQLNIKEPGNEASSHRYSLADAESQGMKISATLSVVSEDPSVIAIEGDDIVAKSVGQSNLTFTTTDKHGIEHNYVVPVKVCPIQGVALGYRTSGNGGPLKSHQTDDGLKLPLLPKTAYELVGFPISHVTNTDADCVSATAVHYTSGLDGEYRVEGSGGFLGMNRTVLYENSLPRENHLLGFALDNLQFQRLASVENVRIESSGFSGKYVAGLANPYKVMGDTNGQVVDLTPAYAVSYNSDTAFASNLTSQLWLEDDQGIDVTFSHGHPDWRGSDEQWPLPNLSLNISSGDFVSSKLRTVWSSGGSARPFEAVEAKHTLSLASGVYDITDLIAELPDLASSYPDAPDLVRLGKWIVATESGLYSQIGILAPHGAHFPSESVELSIGNATPTEIQGRWVDLVSGLDHNVKKYSPLTYTRVTNDEYTYVPLDDVNTTKRISRAGTNDVAVTGNVNVVQSTAVQSFSAHSGFKKSVSNDGISTGRYSAMGLGGIGSLDLILTNVNTGEEYDVTVESDGSFSEQLPTGTYDVFGTATDSGLVYSINTSITVEYDESHTGVLNMAKLGLYNFDASIKTNCPHEYFCYANTSYNMEITVTNTGALPASGVAIQRAIMEGFTHENLTSITVGQLPTVGMVPGSSVAFNITMQFSKPLQDELLEFPVQLKDIEGRIWDDVVHIPLSSRDPYDIEVRSYSPGVNASVNGFLFVEGRTPIRIKTAGITQITIPEVNDAAYEMILSNTSYENETKYSVAVETTVVGNTDFENFDNLVKNEPSDDSFTTATELNAGESEISYLFVNDIDYFKINIPAAP